MPDGWRLGEPAWTVRRLQAAGGEPVEVRLRGRSTAAEVRVGDGEPVPARAFRDGDRLTVTLDGLTLSYTVVHEGGTVWLAADGRVAALREHERLAAHGEGGGRRRRGHLAHAGNGDGGAGSGRRRGGRRGPRCSSSRR